MATNYRQFHCTPQQVFDVLADGWMYGGWVPGAARIREVDFSWPDEQSSIFHSSGIWPLLLHDTTYMIDWAPPRHAKMRARGWPIGEAEVEIDVRPNRNGCVVRIREDAVEGPGTLVPRPIRDVGLWYRNVETLRRLSYIAEGKAGLRP